MFVVLFPFFGTWWWLLTIFIIIFIFACEENDSASGAFMFLAGYFLITTLFGESVSLLNWIGDHPYYTLSAAALYLFLGLPWAAFWWKWKQTEKRGEYNIARRNFLIAKNIIVPGQNHNGVEIPDYLIAEWNKNNWSYPIKTRACWQEHRKTLTCAMTWWPVHMVAFIFKDFFRDLWNRLLNFFHSIFDSIDESTWKDVNSDFREIPTRSEMTFQESRQANKM